MKLTAIVLVGFAVLLLVNLNGLSSVESREIGHHPPGQGHHHHPPPPQRNHHDHDGDGDGDSDEDGDGDSDGDWDGDGGSDGDWDGDDDGDSDGDGDGDGDYDGGHKHGRKHKHHHHHAYDDKFSLYVFGDSFADNGNLPEWDETWPVLSRQWYRPYGGDGRFSNKMVQSDFIAKILGQSAPPAHALEDEPTKIGVNFAVGGSGVFEVPQQKPTLEGQIDSFQKLIRGRKIKKAHLKGKSVAFVAISGNDYNRVGVGTSGLGDLTTFIDKVTTEIVDNVVRLQDIGVRKVIVNNLYPLGCAPSQSKQLNYSACEPMGNQSTALHNSYLSKKLAKIDGADAVLLLDLHTAFSNILLGATDDQDSDDTYSQFAYKLKPCCYGYEADGYCGQMTEVGATKIHVYKFKVCKDPEAYFFFDDMHPTQEGWTAVMGQLEGDIKEFLQIDDQE